MSTPVSQADREAADKFGTAWRMNAAGKFGLANLLHQHAVRAAERALEAAAKVAEGELMLGFEGYDLTGFQGENTRCRAIAKAIRAISPTTILEGSNDG